MTKTKENLINEDYFLEGTNMYAFVYGDEVYSLQWSTRDVRELKNLPAGYIEKIPELAECVSSDNKITVGVGLIRRIHDDPLIPVEGTTEEANEARAYLTELNGIDFHRQYWEYMTKARCEHCAKEMTGGEEELQSLSLEDFLFVLALDCTLAGVAEFKKEDPLDFSNEDPNVFEYRLLGEMPKDREYAYFIVWKTN